MISLKCLLAFFLKIVLILKINGYRSVRLSPYRTSFCNGKFNEVHQLSCSDSSDQTTEGDDDSADFQIWTNPSYPEEQVNKWYLGIDRALITVGSKGVTNGQINSVADLLQQHVHIRVKVASDKLDSHLLSKEMADSEVLVGKAELLQIRKRGFMFGTTEKTAAKNTAIRNAKLLAIESKDVSKIQCFNCDQLGHYSSDCPEPKQKESKASEKATSKFNSKIKR